MHQNVVLAFFHTQNICHGAWKILKTTICCLVFLQSRGEGLKNKENLVTDEARSAPVRPRKKIAWEGDNGKEGRLTNDRPGSGHVI